MPGYAEQSARFQVRFVGLAETVERWREIANAPEATKILASALYKRALAILAVSRRFVPVDTGALRGSGHVRAPLIDGDSVSVEIAYGGAAAPYAFIVHEDLHKRHNPPTQAKYLETPWLAEKQGTLKALHDAVKEVIARRRAARRAA